MDFSETKCEVFAADEKTNLLAHLWLPEGKEKAVFLAIHGGMAHAGDFVTPALYFKKKGVATYALDLRWHGTYPQYNKDGKVFLHIDSFDEYISDIHKFYSWIQQKHPKAPIFILSHSVGALIALTYGLTLAKDTKIRGIIVSSPWLKNNVVIPKLMFSISKVIALLAPKFAVAPEPVTDTLTHDKKITDRHHEDERKGLRGTKASAKFAVVSLKAQEWVIENISKWEKIPVFAVLAGQDHLADPIESEQALRKIPANLLKLIKYEQNFHENFNEMNRVETYDRIWDWMKKLM